VAGAGPDARRITTVLNAIDPVTFRRDRTREAATRAALGIGPDDIVIGSIGRLEFPKRFDLLIDAVAALRPAMPALRCFIVGEGSLRPALERQAGERHVSDSVVFLGHRTDAADLHHAFDIFVHPSDSEGTPNAVLEAMALETPTVASDVGGTRELAQDDVHALIVPPGDGEALTRAVERLLTDGGLARRLADAARRRTETELSFRARMAKVEAVYERLVYGDGGPHGASERMPA
jgi:glycosyltransferase involved in cell wall biosynthesis